MCQAGPRRTVGGSGCIQEHFRPTPLGQGHERRRTEDSRRGERAGGEPRAALLTAGYVALQGREWRQTLLEGLGGPAPTDIS